MSRVAFQGARARLRRPDGAISWPPQRGCGLSSLRSLCRLTRARISVSLCQAGRIKGSICWSGFEKNLEVFFPFVCTSWFSSGRAGVVTLHCSVKNGRGCDRAAPVWSLDLCIVSYALTWLISSLCGSSLCIEAPGEIWQSFSTQPLCIMNRLLSSAVTFLDIWAPVAFLRLLIFSQCGGLTTQYCRLLKGPICNVTNHILLMYGAESLTSAVCGKSTALIKKASFFFKVQKHT